MLIYAIMRLKPNAALDAVVARGPEEARAVWAQIKGDIFRKVSLRIDAPGAVVEVEAASVDAVRAAFASLPLVRDDLVDVDQDAAVKTRMRLLDQVVIDKLAVIGAHLPFPGHGYGSKSGSAYAYEPDRWSNHKTVLSLPTIAIGAVPT
jgi:hypothetical protein